MGARLGCCWDGSKAAEASGSVPLGRSCVLDSLGTAPTYIGATFSMGPGADFVHRSKLGPKWVDLGGVGHFSGDFGQL